MRDALNGQEFVRQVQRKTGFNVVVDGRRRGEIRRLGVISGFPNADGVVGDLGGGSFEVIDVAGGFGQGTTLALGPAPGLDRFQSRGFAAPYRRLLGRAMAWLAQGRVFYAVGGAGETSPARIWSAAITSPRSFTVTNWNVGCAAF